MPSENILRLKNYYENTNQTIGKQLIATCLKECVSYRRGSAFFSSSSFLTYAEALYHVIKDNVKIEILCSPVINDLTLMNVMEKNLSEDEKLKTIQQYQENILSKSLKYKEDPTNKKYLAAEMLAYLIAKEQLIIKIAIKKSKNWPDPWPTDEDIDKHSHLYHVKRGYFVFEDDKRVVFDGSFNETQGSLQDHGEHASVFKSWRDSIEGAWAATRIKLIDRDWEGGNDQLHIRDLSKDLIEKIKKSAKSRKEIDNIPIRKITEKDIVKDKDEYKYRHQKEAIDRFLNKKNGILEMATGTGKTRTALKIINELSDRNLIDQFIVTCYGTDLLDQWYKVLLNNSDSVSVKVYEKFQTIYLRKEQRRSFTQNPKGAGFLTSLDDVHNALDNLSEEQLKRTLIIYDEVHNLGTENRLVRLKDNNKKIIYRLGLSATPDKGKHEKQQQMTAELKNVIGDSIYKFSINQAIERGILCEFSYIPLNYELTDDDKKKFQNVYALDRKRKEEGNPMSIDEKARLLANIYKLSESKLLSFDNFLRNDSSFLKSTIIFVGTEEYGKKVLEIINSYTNNYREYYGDDDKKILEEFIKERIDILVTCKAISQGIDIPNLKNIVIFSSDQNRGETTQRLGRCLRNPQSNEKKVAQVIDFYQIPEEGRESYDQDRRDWLESLSKSKYKVN